MNEQHPIRLVYPMRGIQVGDFPLLDELASVSRKVAARVSFDHNAKLPFKEIICEVTEESMHILLEHARQTGSLEPLASLIHFMIPSYTYADSKNHADLRIFQQSLLPYEKHIELIMKELSENVRFQVQITPDNILGEEILGRGLLIMKSGGNYIAYRYSVETGAKSHVAFERLPDLNSPSLENVIREYHNPESVESPVLVRSKKPYNAKGDILPYFAYRFTGLRK